MESLDFLSRKEQLEKDLTELRAQVAEKEKTLNYLTYQKNHSLSNEEISRYSRQMLLPEIRVKGQEKLKNASVLVVGCGGLGCPAAQYLAGSGVGRIGLVDYDVVEESNLHRQLLHTEANIGRPKVQSAASALRSLNSKIQVVEHEVELNSSNALEIVSQYSVVIDASDNPPTRYLVNDACVLARVPLVSGSAVGLEGQLTVYNYSDGPCYRCLFPQPPPPTAVTSCGDAGVLGCVPGLIGTLQGLQALHLLLGRSEGVLSSRLLLFDGSRSKIREVKLRSKSSDCAVCGEVPSIRQLIDYERFCGTPANDKTIGVKLLSTEERLPVSGLVQVLQTGATPPDSPPPPLLLDVRPEVEFEIASLPGFINLPYTTLDSPAALDRLQTLLTRSRQSVYVICRRGNDSQRAVLKLRELFKKEGNIKFLDVTGGLEAWALQIDPTFPSY